jgi:hypothetical protein
MTLRNRGEPSGFAALMVGSCSGQDRRLRRIRRTAHDTAWARSLFSIALLGRHRFDAGVFGGAPFAVLGHLGATAARFHLAPAAAATVRAIEVEH